MPELDTKAGIAVGAIIALIMGIFSQAIFAKQEQVIIENNNPSNIKNSSNIPCTYNIIQVVGGTSRNIQAINCKTGLIDFQSTNASNVFNNVMNVFNNTGGGYVHITGYNSTHPYNITTAILIPAHGHLNFYGDGNEYTFLQIPSGSDNDMFLFTGRKSSPSFFNYFSEFAMFGNDGVGGGGVHNDGFKFNSTNAGMSDSLVWNVFIEHFKQDDYFANQYSIWNMRLNQDTIEDGGNACVNIAGDGTGAEMRITDSKIIFCNGIGIQVQQTNNMQIINNWFYKNQKGDIKFIAGTSFSENIQNNNFQNSGLASTNTYYQMNLAGFAYSVVEGNNFNSASSGNKPIGPIFLGSASVKNVIVNNNSFGTFSYGTTSSIKATNGLDSNYIVNNLGTNPFNKITNFVDGSNWTPYGTTGTIVNATTYTIWDAPIFTTVSGGTGVNVTMLDNNNNLIQKGLATITQQYLPVGYKIKINFSSAPTVTVFFH